MQELSDFFNDGYGWACRHCTRELELASPEGPARSRLLSEGEAESKQPELSHKALAKWADPARRVLICPRCGVTELVDIK